MDYKTFRNHLIRYQTEGGRSGLFFLYAVGIGFFVCFLIGEICKSHGMATHGYDLLAGGVSFFLMWWLFWRFAIVQLICSLLITLAFATAAGTAGWRLGSGAGIFFFLVVFIGVGLFHFGAMRDAECEE